MVKHGKTKGNKQRFRCTQVVSYSYKAYQKQINPKIVTLTKEGVGIRSTSRILKVSATTVLSRIIKIADSIKQPPISKYKSYQVDEICTYLKTKTNFIWIVYALDEQSKKVVSFKVGKRTNKTLRKVIDFLHLSQAQKIVTDKLKNYQFLIEKQIHSTKFRGINHIERNNLTLRTHLKRLNRRTICFSRSLVVLSAVLKIYFWSNF